jgi:transcription initiation factor TFIIIB Brf1 subunit/transcription initiation factor TFIIB
MVDLDLIWNQLDQVRYVEPTPDPLEPYICPCGGLKMFMRGELPVCPECGRVDDYFLDEEAEWTSGIDNDGNVSDPSRCGATESPFFSSGWNMGTIIKNGSKTMTKIHFHMSMNHCDRSLFHAYAEIERAGRDRLKCSDAVIDAAKLIYKEFSEKKLTRGDVRAGVKANCLFLACKKFGVPRTTKEVADAFSIDTNDVGRTSSMLKETVNQTQASITKPRDVISRVFNQFDHPDKQRIKMDTLRLLDRVEKLPALMGKTPSGVASAAIWIAGAGRISKLEICGAVGVSLPTLNKIEGIIRC